MSEGLVPEYAAPDPELAAKIVRERYWGGDLPVDPVAIARRLGLDVISSDLPPNVSGGLLKRVGHDPVIVLSRMDHANRQRFTCAHELGHFVARSGGDEYEYSDLRSDLSSTGRNAAERYANAFAAALLMPADLVRQKFLQDQIPAVLAMHFGVSPDAMGWRLRKLGLQPPQQLPFTF